MRGDHELQEWAEKHPGKDLEIIEEEEEKSDARHDMPVCDRPVTGDQRSA